MKCISHHVILLILRIKGYDISVDQFFFPDKSAEKDTQRRQLDTLLDSMSEKGIRVVTATAKEIAEVETEDRGMSRTEF